MARHRANFLQARSDSADGHARARPQRCAHASIPWSCGAAARENLDGWTGLSRHHDHAWPSPPVRGLPGRVHCRALAVRSRDLARRQAAVLVTDARSLARADPALRRRLDQCGGQSRQVDLRARDQSAPAHRRRHLGRARSTIMRCGPTKTWSPRLATSWPTRFAQGSPIPCVATRSGTPCGSRRNSRYPRRQSRQSPCRRNLARTRWPRRSALCARWASPAQARPVARRARSYRGRYPFSRRRELSPSA